MAALKITLAEVQAQVWLIDGEQRFGGHRAVAWLLINQSKFAWKLLGHLLNAFSPISAMVYTWVAKNRHRLPGGTKECSIVDRP